MLTRDRNYEAKGAVIVHDEEELMNELGKYDTEQIYIIGGESVYKMMLSYCDKIYVTKVDRAFQADTYFPNLDEMSEWKMTQESEEQTCFDLEFCFTTMKDVKKKIWRETGPAVLVLCLAVICAGMWSIHRLDKDGGIENKTKQMKMGG